MSPSLTLFEPLKKRAAGVVLHPSSLPGPLGIGQFGVHARRFIDFLADAGFRVWQVCPLGPTGYGDSPYQSLSSFAGNPYFIDLELLVQEGLLESKDLDPLRQLPEDYVDYGALFRLHACILGKACLRCQTPDFRKFKQANQAWMAPYALFQALKQHFNGAPWWDWPNGFHSFQSAQQQELVKNGTLEAVLHKQFIIQYFFSKQWMSLKAYANSKGISILGDLPIYVALDSSDFWEDPSLFQTDASGKASLVAGVPPDYFSKTGQLWGNPLYDWKAHAKTGYTWWMRRIAHHLKLYDKVRLDHFRGFEAYWSVPAGSPDARPGTWKKGPGLPFFKAIKQHFPKANLIAEDLGEITDSVRTLLKQTGLPGMAVLQFAFGDTDENPFLPDNILPNSVAYTATHDNIPTTGWYAALDPSTRNRVDSFIARTDGGIAWDCLQSLYWSDAALAIVPVQDLLDLGSESAMNIPGRPDGNWQWRMSSSQFAELADVTQALHQSAKLTRRLR